MTKDSEAPMFDNGFAVLYQANARQLPIPDNSVDCVVTSPPYWGLRDYKTGEWSGGDEGCNHLQFNDTRDPDQVKQVSNVGTNQLGYKDVCGKCGAKRIDEQIGLEPTPEEYCANMVAVFREVWRVLKPTGTVWLNLGDSYAGNNSRASNNGRAGYGNPREGVFPKYGEGLKPKDLVGIPWRIAFALQADGWYLRSDIIWSKLNPMPESVTDRPTKAHEYVFLLTKNARYYYDADAIREPMVYPDARYNSNVVSHKNHIMYQEGNRTRGTLHDGRTQYGNPELGRNKRTVWEISTQPYSEAHFATFPEKLVEPCILAGTSERGVCAECGKPWERIVERDIAYDHVTTQPGKQKNGPYELQTGNGIGTHDIRHGVYSIHTQKGWQPTCECNAETVPAAVLDPFSGSGTTLAVAQKLGRKGIGTDLNVEYIHMATERLSQIPLPMLLM